VVGGEGLRPAELVEVAEVADEREPGRIPHVDEAEMPGAQALPGLVFVRP
jgi:hypothetical protein